MAVAHGNMGGLPPSDPWWSERCLARGPALSHVAGIFGVCEECAMAPPPAIDVAARLRALGFTGDPEAIVDPDSLPTIREGRYTTGASRWAVGQMTPREKDRLRFLIWVETRRGYR